MAEHFSFFDAVLQDDGVTYDREYNAQQFTDYFKTLVTTGVMKGAGNMLAVIANGSNMVTSLNTGIAFIEGRYYLNDAPLSLTHDTETLGNSRIDRIVIRLDLSTEARYVKAFVKKGVPSTNPVAPTLKQTSNLYEISLAHVKIVGGQTFIAANAVTDERGTNVICPWAGSNILPSFDDNALADHIRNMDVHIRSGEREAWTKKRDVYARADSFGPNGYPDPNTFLEANMITDHKNAQSNGSTGFWYIQQIWYGTPGGDSKRSQIATTYGGDKPNIKVRHYNGEWSLWSDSSLFIALGNNATTVGWGGTAIGPNAKASNNGMAIGLNSEALDGSVAMGRSAQAYTGADSKVSSAFGTGANAHNGSFAIGDNATAVNKGVGVIGATLTENEGTKNWIVPGHFSIQGTKNFEIPHPHPDKKYTHLLRHGAVESPTTGDTLYRYKVEAVTDGETVEIQLPDYFEYLNTNVDVWVNPDEHFGRAYGKVVGDKLLVTCEKIGVYKALVIGTRNDDNVQDWYIKGVERAIGESWQGETYVFEVDEIEEVTEFEEVLQ